MTDLISNARRLSADQFARLLPLEDRLVVRVEPEKSEHHGLVIPEIARRAGAMGGDKFLRIGVVVKAGPGDAWPPFQGFCPECVEAVWLWPAPEADVDHQRCPNCKNLVMELSSEPGRRRPMDVGVGDRILFDRPSDRLLAVEGDDAEYVFLHEEQHVLAVLEEEEDAAWDAPGYRNGQPDYEASIDA
jgi:co-chaperonin GroES (HSP10)